jgi:hypothetical protein
MSKKIAILYDLKGKSNSERTQLLRKLYGYKDKSNYDYSYDRIGLLNKIPLQKSRKTVLYLKNRIDADKVTNILKDCNIEFELAEF